MDETLRRLEREFLEDQTQTKLIRLWMEQIRSGNRIELEILPQHLITDRELESLVKTFPMEQVSLFNVTLPQLYLRLYVSAYNANFIDNTFGDNIRHLQIAEARWQPVSETGEFHLRLAIPGWVDNLYLNIAYLRNGKKLQLPISECPECSRLCYLTDIPSADPQELQRTSSHYRRLLNGAIYDNDILPVEVDCIDEHNIVVEEHGVDLIQMCRGTNSLGEEIYFSRRPDVIHAPYRLDAQRAAKNVSVSEQMTTVFGGYSFDLPMTKPFDPDEFYASDKEVWG